MNRLSFFNLAAISILFGLSACQAPVKIDLAPNAAEYESQPKSGTASIQGEVTARTKGGDLKSSAGLPVHLDPVTSYSTALYDALKAKGEIGAENESETVIIDPVMAKARRTVRIDSLNHFIFYKIPAGDYYISCYTHWMTRGGSWTGGWKFRRIHVEAGHTLRRVLL